MDTSINKEKDNVVVASLFPQPIDFLVSPIDQNETIAEVVEADDKCRMQKDGSCVQMYDEDEFQGQPAIEVMGPSAQIAFACPNLKPDFNLLFLYLKCEDQFFAVEVQVVDHHHKVYTLTFSNRKSLVRIDGNNASIPIIIADGFKWQLLKFDLKHILARAFPNHPAFYAAIHVTIFSSCRVFRLYLADQEYADIQLPPHLQILRPPPPS